MSKPKSVSTNRESDAVEILTSLDSLSLEEKAKLFAMLKTDTAVVTQAMSEIEAEVNQLNGIIEERRRQVASINEEIKSHLLRINTLTGRNIKVEGERRTRTTSVCSECGQGRHADNAKTRNCQTYAAAQAAKVQTVAA